MSYLLYRGGIAILLDLIYPNICAVCGKINKTSICEECNTKLKQEIKFTEIWHNNKEFDKLIYFCNYDGVIRKRFLEYKFSSKAYLYKFFSEIITKNEKGCSFFKKYDIITPVPIHKKRKLTRGFNQSELIARNIAKSFPNLTYMNTLKKVKNTIAQSSLNETQRKANIREAYQLLNVDLTRKKVILFDDICTTGATANECSKVLKKAGAKDIAVVAIAKG